MRPVRSITLAPKGLFEIALLHRAERVIDDDQLRALRLGLRGDLLHLAAAEERGGLDLADAEALAPHDIDADGERKPLRLLKPGRRIAQRRARHIGAHD
jgi:hypothetical protein